LRIPSFHRYELERQQRSIPVVSELDCDCRGRRHVDADSAPNAGAGMGFIAGDAGMTAAV
jgi:hypothetical protein